MTHDHDLDFNVQSGKQEMAHDRDMNFNVHYGKQTFIQVWEPSGKPLSSVWEAAEAFTHENVCFD